MELVWANCMLKFLGSETSVEFTSFIKVNRMQFPSLCKSLDTICLFLFLFPLLQEVRSQRILLRFILKSVLPIFSSKSFIFSGLTFTSLSHFRFFLQLLLFQFIFVYGVRKCSNFILLYVADQFSQHHLLKSLSIFSPLYICPLCQRKVAHRYVDLSLGFLS